MNNLKIPDDAFETIAREIASEQSVVGIDAKKTHILILHMLMEMSDRLDRIEARLEKRA